MERDAVDAMTSGSTALRPPQSASERQAMVVALEDGRSWPSAAAGLLAELGFRLVEADRMADDDSHLVVALRATPTLRHFDPECVAYYGPCGAAAALTTIDRSITSGGGERANRRVLWGHVHVVDRIPVQNRFLTFGGDLRAAAVDSDLTVLDLWSPAPIVRWGGHSQATDPIAAAMGAFFGRLIVPVNYVPGIAENVDALLPEVLYRAFLIDALARSARTRHGDSERSPLDMWLLAAWSRARTDRQACTAAQELLAELDLA
jgi:hypothetical protein